MTYQPMPIFIPIHNRGSASIDSSPLIAKIALSSVCIAIFLMMTGVVFAVLNDFCEEWYQKLLAIAVYISLSVAILSIPVSIWW